MPIPPFTLDGLLPPYTNPHGPGGHLEEMTPFRASPSEVVDALGTSPGRIAILQGWLDHRSLLRGIGMVDGFQWLDGSFVENKEPKDLDLVSFCKRPTSCTTPDQFLALIRANLGIIERGAIRRSFPLDHFFLDLDMPPKDLVSLTRYYLGLFSHRRADFVWKGMLEVPLTESGDAMANLALHGRMAP